MPLTYSSYLQLDKLLNIQKPLSDGPDHDEMLFIIIHQAYELWFKEILHELDYLKQLLLNNDLPRSLHTMKRILTILKVLVHQTDILETMTPLEFLTFRDRLESASGFQSFQFRELEFVLGHKKEKILDKFDESSDEKKLLQKRFNEPSLWNVFLKFLTLNEYPVPADVISSESNDVSSKQLDNLLCEIYKNNPNIAQFCELLLDLDEGFQEWRYRHVKMVERTIGTKTGTGGSDGVKYLVTTLSIKFFPVLWSIRKDFNK
ncbi:MAG TPA: tryptophan 2,3-dioxygenase family protein [Ignavibacteriaceae bacterium]|nr:tryptophan 2,3-dioxygenase family protein [Ignavibacteriaceae bacterium]